MAGWGEWYEVSNNGRVRSWKGLGSAYRQRASEARILRAGVSEGYSSVVLSNQPARRTVTVHKLVAETFIGPRPPGMHICHNDGNPANNHVSNLRYDTPSGNLNDRRHHGTHPEGERHGRSKLTDANVREIRRRYASGESAAVIACDFGVHRSTARRIATGEKWQHVA